MSALVAYGSSDESDESENEEVLLSKQIKTSKEEKTSKDLLNNREETADNMQDNKIQYLDNLPISDDEDFIPSATVQSSSASTVGLQLPPPKNEKSMGGGDVRKQTDHSILSGLPKPKNESTEFLDKEEDELEDFVKPKYPDMSNVPEKPPPVITAKKRKTIQITVPELPGDSDEEEDGVSKKLKKDIPAKPKGKYGLFAVLPPPKYVTASKDQGKMFMPSSISKPSISSKQTDLTKNQAASVELPPANLNSPKDSEGQKFKSNVFIPQSLTRKTKQSSLSAFNLETGMMIASKTTKKGNTDNKLVGSESTDIIEKDNTLKSNIKLAGVPMEEDSDEEDDDENPSSFFSLSDKKCDNGQNELSSSSLVATSSVSTLPGVTLEKEKTDQIEDVSQVQNEPLTFSETASPEMQDAPLQFKKTAHPYQQVPYGMTGASYQYQAGPSGYYSNQQYNLANVEQEGDEDKCEEVEEESGDIMKDQEFLKMQGKSKRGKEEINFIDVRQDDQITDYDATVTKNLTEEQNVMSYSKKKNKDMPSSQQKRKHQITYLAFRAKERELELKNQWADNRMNKRQSQAKYGF